MGLLLQRLIPIMLDSKVSRMLAENVAVSIGRLGIACPDEIAPHLDKIALAWCTRLKNVVDNSEKLTACQGMNQVVRLNPHGLAGVRLLYLLIYMI